MGFKKSLKKVTKKIVSNKAFQKQVQTTLKENVTSENLTLAFESIGSGGA